MLLLTDKYFKKYLKEISDLKTKIANFRQDSKELTFDYLLDASSVYSSNIEGNSTDLNSYMNAKLHNAKKTKDIKEIEELREAYDFAKTHSLNEKNFLEAHRILTKTLLIKSNRGVYRNQPVGVFGATGLVYLAIEPEFVEKSMKELFEDIKELLDKDLTEEEVFYFASQIHLKFVHIHPFIDGNGRSARLLEKWFLTAKLGEDFWKLQSEKYYKENRLEYYKNINLGVNYYEIDYDNSIDFLAMLSKSIENGSGKMEY